MLDHTQAVVGILVGAVTLLAALGAWVRWVRPGFRKVKAEFITGRDTLVGREAVIDSITGRELVPAVPGVGAQLANLTDTVAQLADNHRRLEDHEARISRTEAYVAELKAATLERIVTKAESAQMWRAVAGGELDKPDDN